MNKYNFDKKTNRVSTYSLKWSESNTLPMWVADMDFETAPEVKSEIIKRAEHGIFGYSEINDEWREAYTSWWRRRHLLEMNKDRLIFSTGVVPSVSSIIRHLTGKGDGIVILSPVYNCFYKCIKNNNRVVVESKLIYRNNTYSIDFDDLEEKLKKKENTLLLFCNPHNPVGRIWKEDELRRVGEIALKTGTLVITDEIHCDLTTPGKDYIPFIGLDKRFEENTLMLMSPTKTFNLAGINTSAMYVPNESLYNTIERGINIDECGEPGAFAIPSVIAAFRYGEEWLNELRVYLQNNKEIVENYVKKNIPSLSVVTGDATYLMWLDYTKINKDSDLASFIKKKTGLWITEGSEYGSGGEGFLRMNIATQKENVLDGLERLKRGIELYKL